MPGIPGPAQQVSEDASTTGVGVQDYEGEGNNDLRSSRDPKIQEAKTEVRTGRK